MTKAVNPEEYYELGLAFHGHKCPAMPMGLRVGAAAMNALCGASQGRQILALIELGEDHCATCFADGVQVITGCTHGKGNIRKLLYGKWGVTLIEMATGRAVRVTPKAEAMLPNKQTEFFKQYREKGVPASKVPPEAVEPLVQRVLEASEEMLLFVGEVFHYDLENRPHSFSSLVCDFDREEEVSNVKRRLLPSP